MSCEINDDAKLLMEITSSIVIRGHPILDKTVTKITSPCRIIHMHEDALIQCGHVPSPNQWRHCLLRFCNFNSDVSICSCIEGVLLPSVMLRMLTCVQAGYIIF